jgi:thiosulfate/3-mercaptopyruvate sulfurtransferase
MCFMSINNKMQTENLAKTIETYELAALMDAKTPDLKVIDASWVMNKDLPQGEVLFEKEHIPGSQFFNIDTIADTNSGLVVTFPPKDIWVENMKRMNLGKTDKFIVYDQTGIFPSTRAWFMLVAWGATDVSVLNGGYLKWKAEERETEAGAVEIEAGSDESWELQPGRLALLEDIHRASSKIVNHTNDAPTIVESRPSEAFEAGTVVGAINVPTPSLFQEDKTFIPDDQIRESFKDIKIQNQDVVFTCGGGMTATTGVFMLEKIGHQGTIGMYDGSFQEYSKFKVPDFQDENWEANFERVPRD